MSDEGDGPAEAPAVDRVQPSSDVLLATGALIRGDLATFEALLARDAGAFPTWLGAMLQERLGPTAFCLLPPTPAGDVQARARDALRPHYQANWRRNQRHHQRTLDLSAALAARGVDATVLKGTPLALRLYGDVAGRSTGDIDLLVVGERPFRTFLDALTDMGFHGRDRPRVSLEVARRFCHHVVFVGNRLMVEAHWDLRRHVSFAVDLERLVATREQCTSTRGTLPIASDGYELLLLLLSVHDDAGRAELGLRTLVDIAVLARRLEARDEWGAFFAQRRGERLLRLSVNVLDLAVGLLQLHDALPRLATALGEHADLLVTRRRDAYAALFERGRRAWVRNRRWTMAVEESTWATSVAWWAVSLPIRLEVYRVPTG